MRRPVRPIIALLLAACGLAGVSSPAVALPPVNDDYLPSIPVNSRGTDLPATQARDIKDTREATVQTDLFSPPSAGGGVERTDCKGTRYGATVWYDFHPHVGGAVHVQAAGFDAAIAIHEFDPTTQRIGTRVECSNGVGATEEVYADVKRRRSYTIQIGGTLTPLGPATGMLEFKFEYFADTDGDGVLDALDKCPDEPGTNDGCPAKLDASAHLRAVGLPGGVRIRSLSVTVPKGARVQVRCRRSGCGFRQSRTARRSGVMRFTRLTNRALPAGAKLEIFVTKADSIGRYFSYAIVRGNVKRSSDRCLRPGSMTPQRCQ